MHAIWQDSCKQNLQQLVGLENVFSFFFYPLGGNPFGGGSPFGPGVDPEEILNAFFRERDSPFGFATRSGGFDNNYTEVQQVNRSLVHSK